VLSIAGDAAIAEEAIWTFVFSLIVGNTTDLAARHCCLAITGGHGLLVVTIRHDYDI
jgi:hypothetical protein